MATGGYSNIDGKVRKIIKGYCNVDGKVRKIIKGYCNVDGKVRKIYDTASGGENYTITKVVKCINPVYVSILMNYFQIPSTANFGQKINIGCTLTETDVNTFFDSYSSVPNVTFEKGATVCLNNSFIMPNSNVTITIEAKI